MLAAEKRRHTQLFSFLGTPGVLLGGYSNNRFLCAVTSKTCQRKNRHTGRVSVTTKTASVRSDAPRALQVRASDALLHAEDNPVTLRHSDTGSYPWSRCPGCTIPRRCSPTRAVGSTPRLCCSLRDGRCRHRPFTRLDLGMSLNCPGTSRSVGVQLFFSSVGPTIVTNLYLLFVGP